LNPHNNDFESAGSQGCGKVVLEDPAYRLIVVIHGGAECGAKKDGKASIQVKAPTVAGKARFFVGILKVKTSRADVVPIDVTVVARSTVVRTEKVPEIKTEERLRKTSSLFNSLLFDANKCCTYST
jgi:hypothetical protein